MSDNDFIKQSRGATLRGWALTEMLRGAGYAAAVLVGIGLLMYGIHLAGKLLPEQSKTAPSPYGFMLEHPAPMATLRVV